MSLTLAIYQGPPVQGDPALGLETLARQLRAAAAAGAHMMVAPELFLPGYNQPALHATLSQRRDGDWIKNLRALCADARCGLTVGWAERDEDQIYNAATALGPDGAILGHYRKIQLFGAMEKASFQPGDRYCVFDFHGLKTALLICYDVEFAPHVRALAEQGVALILVPTANPVGFEHVSTHFVPARAAEMGVSIAYANYCGAEGDLSFGGGSVLVGPDARILAHAGRSETLLITSLEDEIDPVLRSTQLVDFRKV